MAIKQMRKPNKRTNNSQMKYLTISVELCKLMRTFFYAYAHYHISCIRFARERPFENDTYLIYAYSHSLNEHMRSYPVRLDLVV